MFRKISLIVIASLFIFAMSKLSFAMSCGDHGSNQQMTQAEHQHQAADVDTKINNEKVVDAGNKICPVSGEVINEETKVTYEYEGKIYNFCCPMCIDKFRNNPEKYIKKVDEELQAESKGQSEHEGHEMEMIQESETSHQGHHH